MKGIWLLVAFLGFMVHFLLVLGTNRLCGCTTRWKQAILAGLLGGIHAGACLLSGFGFLAQMHWRVIVLLLSAWTAFRYGGAMLRRGALFVLLHLAVGQIALGEVWPFLLATGVICLLCGTGLGPEQPKGEYAAVTITHGGRTVHLTALVDTGNTLKDPISGHRVLVVDSDVAWKLLGMDPTLLQKPLDTFTSHFTAGLRLIPYQTVGQPSGMLLGLRADELKINGKSQMQIVAFAPQKIGEGKPFQALSGGTL